MLTKTRLPVFFKRKESQIKHPDSKVLKNEPKLTAFLGQKQINEGQHVCRLKQIFSSG